MQWPQKSNTKKPLNCLLRSSHRFQESCSTLRSSCLQFANRASHSTIVTDRYRSVLPNLLHLKRLSPRGPKLSTSASTAVEHRPHAQLAGDLCQDPLVLAPQAARGGSVPRGPVGWEAARRQGRRFKNSVYLTISRTIYNALKARLYTHCTKAAFSPWENVAFSHGTREGASALF